MRGDKSGNRASGLPLTSLNWELVQGLQGFRIHWLFLTIAYTAMCCEIRGR